MEMLSREWLEEIIHLLNERIVVVNREGIIQYMDKAYCDFIHTTQDEVVGKPVQDVIENTRMHIVAKTGKEEIQDFQPINDSVMVASRFPIMIDGKLEGAVGTVMFPDPEKLRSFKNNIKQLINDLRYYRSEVEKDLKSKYTFDDLVGESPEFRKLKEFAKVVSGSDSSVLLTGESGTGKELFANAIHNSSLRDDHPFVPINCAAIPEELLESELFGYEDGAFTGAKRGGKKGLFEIAEKGTVFLDEIGDMPLSMQSKLLRALQEREIQPVGGQKIIPIDVRIIAATHRDLEKMVEEGTFRQDLYYRINVIHLEIPPLRKRKDDIPLLSNMLLKKLEKKFYRKGVHLSTEVMERFQQHSWPGNVRELENVLERAINVLDNDTIELGDVPLYIRDQKSDETSTEDSKLPSSNSESNLASLPIQPLKDTMALVEKQVIEKTLEFTHGNKLKAAKLLGIGKTSLYDKCKVYDIK
ncbi:sigma-54 interaction domain-containing protein [Oceanobacillus salinisoli]|uniref:sigma-54 interaction domain-containing protein n=1 Tax=Oceanobacillus salinisoli TaxID=2678611 RepID=UPI0012E11D67|nr:sigma 54-interacting transcriptional regulator [Oceanobacillus salinisoli]